jgi:hypothetical protein
MNRTVSAAIVLVMCVFLTSLVSPASAQTAATLCLGDGSRLAVAAPAPEGTAQSFGEVAFGPEARGVIYLQGGGCTVTSLCPDGHTLSCTGLSCSTTTVACSGQGSTCPGQATTQNAVKCDGAIRASCPCPQVCFGCGTSCTTNANCASVCTCGGGRCSGGHCSCFF